MATPQYYEEVLVTLEAVDPPSTLSFPSRRLFLSNSNPTIFIGRTSRRNADLAASETNAWIDSAVMSRDHAQLSLDADSQTVLIKDLGSLHGTFFNNTRLGPHQSRALRDGDQLRFGTAIERGLDLFPPCTMRTTVQFGMLRPFQPPTVFKVPDDSDEEELSNDEYDGIHQSSQILQDHKIHPAHHDPSLNTSYVAIDLTDQVETSQSTSLEAQEKFGSEVSQSRIPTPPETCEAFGETFVISEDSDVEDGMSEDLDDQSYSAEDVHDQTLREDLFDEDEDIESSNANEITPSIDASTLPQPESESPESTRLPPILDFSNMGSASNFISPGPILRRLPSLHETIQAHELSMNREKMDNNDQNEGIEIIRPSIVSEAPEFNSSKAWEEEFARDIAAHSNPLLASGAEFLSSPQRESCQSNVTFNGQPPDDTLSEFELTKKAIRQVSLIPPLKMKPFVIQPMEPLNMKPLEPLQPLLSTKVAHINHQINEASPKKRKAVEISSDTEETPVNTSSAPVSALVDPEPKRRNVPPPSSSPTVVVSKSNEPPTKRLRKAAEIFGYAALGGVAVVSALIATAPAL